jgi:hypothetical protein
MAGWQVVLLVLAGVFVGMWIPVSVQLLLTLRSAKKLLDTTGSRGGETLAQLTDTAIGLKETLASVGELARSANQLKESIRIISSIGAAVVPAVVALVRALREPAATEAPAGNGAAHASEGPPTGVPARPLSEQTSERREDRQ